MVPPLTKQQPILVFTDGASEDALHVVGGLIFFPGDVPPRFFGGKVPKGLTDEWFVDLKRVIGPVETAISACGHYFLSRQPNKALRAWSVNSLASVAARKEV